MSDACSLIPSSMHPALTLSSFTNAAPTCTHTLSLHDALPICAEQYPRTVNGPTFARSTKCADDPNPLAPTGELGGATVLFYVMTDVSPAAPSLPSMHVRCPYFGFSERSPYADPVCVRSTEPPK